MALPDFIQSPLLLEAAGVWHVFAGVDPEAGRDGRARLRGAFSIPPDSVGTLRQVHSAAVLEMEDGDCGDPDGGRREGDALWTARAGRGVGVRTADCAPILLAHREFPLAVAVHAGWRGLAAGIVGETVRVLLGRFGERVVDGLLAAVGPCARGCCYEVGEEVAAALRPLPGGPDALRPGAAPGKRMADLPALALSQLAAAGIPANRCDAVGICTICDSRFHSYRREKSLTLRQLSLTYIM
jgi:YfiH family protein